MAFVNFNGNRTRTFLGHQSKDVVGKLVGATTHGATPLVMACRNGHYDVVEYLIEKCGADVEQTGSVVFDGDTIEGAPPLWCAAAAGHLAVVELLVKRGAKVNTTTKTNSTPLRAACFDGYFEIVKFLVKHGADIEVANRHGHTSLMIACFRGHVKITKFLLSLKADANRKSVKGNTALHDCAESGSLEIMKVLIEHGARMDVDSFGMTPLLTAAITGHTHIVEYLIWLPHLVCRKEKIDALELLGATYVDKKRDMIGALEFWKRAMDERYRGDGPVIPKPAVLPGVAAYDFAREITDPEALDDLFADPDEMRMQALIIRERILGPAHPDTSYYIRFRGALYADAGKFNRCIELWNYALDIQQSMLEPLNSMTQGSLFSFTELFSFLIGDEGKQTRRGQRVPPVQREELMRVFKKAVLEVKLGKQMLDKMPRCERDLTNLNRVLVIALHLACLLTRETPKSDSAEHMELHRVLYELVKINATGKEGRDVLQLAHSKDAALIGGYAACEFPSPHLTRALLKVGADVKAKDCDGNTALHLVALSQPWNIELAKTLLDGGAYINAVNNENKTYEMLLKDKRLFAAVNPLKYTTLTCLAARVVLQTQPINKVPRHLQHFFEIYYTKKMCRQMLSLLNEKT
ncbi:protein fem-1 homolog CG6966 isoform X2 [Leptopilina heterotoma]|uniref:protein fem-1 homolog CG6966 isoform X2 n=1 Tax=Leptopilina heterotoma TaxID=63436 RepID=UPI001CA8EBB8|nr:protein fem-1 homolog CG6966 isoform X2 [Leptopilina heterotoma]